MAEKEDADVLLFQLKRYHTFIKVCMFKIEFNRIEQPT